jgi:[ribosomal protein S5]-alanine N-acetyltransferase
LTAGEIGTRPQLPLKTHRLLLREFAEADWLPVHSYTSDPEVFRYVEGGPLNDQQTRASIQKAIAGQREDPRLDFRLAVTLNEEGRLIGDARLRVLDPNLHPAYRLLGQAYIGFYINRHYWRQGYASEVAQALLTLGFDQLRLHRIFAWCDTENPASTRVLEKAGMRREGVLRRNWTIRGEWRDAFLYAMVESDWSSSLGAAKS